MLRIEEPSENHTETCTMVYGSLTMYLVHTFLLFRSDPNPNPNSHPRPNERPGGRKLGERKRRVLGMRRNRERGGLEGKITLDQSEGILYSLKIASLTEPSECGGTERRKRPLDQSDGVKALGGKKSH